MKITRILVFLVLLTVVLGTYLVLFRKNPSGPEKPALIPVPKGMTLSQLADTLAAHNLLNSHLSFTLAGRLLGASHKLHAGLYKIEYGLSNQEIVRRLTGSEYALIFQSTFPEGSTMYRVASIAHEKLHIDSALFIAYAKDSAFLHTLGIPREARTAEGYLFPDSYQFLFEANPKNLLTTMVKRWRSIVFDSLLKGDATKHLSVHQLMTFASIVEGEARVAAERDTVAGVYWNRLQIGMKLDADPTVQYGLHLNRPITHEDLLRSSPYNTYMNPGLPMGPVNNPGAAAIRAAMHPAKHPYLYFVARRDGSGGHYFSKTLADQSRRINDSHRNAAGE